MDHLFALPGVDGEAPTTEFPAVRGGGIDMLCPKCGNPGDDSLTECARCGLIFARYRGKATRPARGAGRQQTGILTGLLEMKKLPGIAGLYGRGVLLLILFLWSGWFILGPEWARYAYAMKSFMHLVDLPIHEAGHVFFGFTGSRIVTSLGGSLMQILIPLVCVIVLLFSSGDPFGASVALWWLGQSFIDMAPYIDDARSLALPLIGGNTGATAPYGFHDWNYILSETGLLEREHLIADLSSAAGTALMLASIAWGAAVLLRCSRIGRAP